MRKLRKKLLSAALALIVTVSASQVSVWSEDAPEVDEEAVAPAEEIPEESGATFVTEADALAAMSKKAENSRLVLYVNEDNYTFAVENKANGHIWWSSYYNTDPDERVQLSRRSTLMTVEVVGTESKAIESSRAYDSNVKKTVTPIDNGVRFTFYFNKYEMEIPLDITLNGDGSFTATIPTSEIQENRPETNADGDTGYQLLNIHVLENFGGTDRSEDGLMIVPDGSGAVIDYNNGALAGDNNTYESVVYGRDLAVGLLQAGPVIEKVTMPVLGRITRGDSEDNGLVLIATEGDEFSTVHAAVTGQNVTDLNNAWFEFSVRTQDKYYMGSGNEPLAVYESRGIKTGNVSVTYYPISGDDLSYIDVANVYRDYLEEDLGVAKKTKSDDAPFYLTLYGGTVKSRSIMGFPVNIQTTATTYKEALEIVQGLEANGVDNIKIIYEDFNEAGIVGEIAATFQYSSKLGGKSDYEAFSSYVTAHGYEIFPSCDIMEFNKSGNGYSFTLNSSKQITNSYATQTPFDLAYGIPHLTKSSWTILSPYYFSDIFNKLCDSFTKEGATGISLNQAGNVLYSDFSRHNPEGRSYLIRSDTVAILQEGYQKLRDSGLSILSENANQYLLPYTDYIKDVPLYSSNYDIISYDIPFAQMVLHGLIPYTSKALNKSANAEELRLLSLVTGTPIHYEMMYENPNTFSDSEYDTLFYTSYSGWADDACREYTLFNEIVSKVSDAKITDYERISDVEFESTFENGTKIYVNLDTEAIRVNGTDYRLTDYGLGVSEE
ncbi:MAG: DUF5696 domain-containing protein [Bacteroides sp.]|nr:DUF5696 domain-containing protein [Eubacterium sp.]MCM1418902.1 DUF5696 domain-containing protein [Roseburia sp.]MCM1461510.1 DUF5696 domain-containing protein [Bacteroides sp.]